MYKYFVLILMLLSFACTETSISNDFKINGEILNYKGEPIEFGHIRQVVFGNEIKDTLIELNSSEFDLEIANDGLARFVISVPYHKPDYVEIPLDLLNKKTKLTIQMSPYVPDMESKGLVIIGDFNNFDFNNGVMLEEESEGVFSADVPLTGDTTRYQVTGLINVPYPRSINGSQQDMFELDQSGDYRSMIISNKSSQTIKVDLSKYASENSEFSLESSNKKLDAYHNASRNANLIFSNIDQELRQLFPPSTETQKQQIEDKIEEGLSQLRSEFENNKGEAANSYGLKYLELVTYTSAIGGNDQADKEFIKEVYSSVSADSYQWLKSSFAVLNTLSIIEENPIESEYFNSILNDNKLKSVNMELLYFGLEYGFENGQEEIASKLYKQLVENYPNSKQTVEARKKYNPNRKIMKGKDIPSFELSSIDSDVTFTPESFKGKYVLYDIWATWCGPCVREMPNLHKAYEMYKDKNFTIFSLSIDREKAAITNFRNGRWKMPWEHTFLPGVWESKLTEIFEVSSVPRPILVGPDGKIITVNPNELRGEKLIQTIGRYVN